MKKGLTPYRAITLITGVGIALAIVVSQLFYFRLVDRPVNPVETEQSEEAAFISMPSVTLPSSSSVVQTNQEFSFILEILLEDSHQHTEAVPFTSVFDKLFRTLFRVVISPNAP
ncbi:MAG: hypothetical protein L6Q51_02475 [Cyclobacteriaceae bacterium]|nr:hypothetical protein [Cyclobacteriaceae bacterium]